MTTAREAKLSGKHSAWCRTWASRCFRRTCRRSRGSSSRNNWRRNAPAARCLKSEKIISFICYIKAATERFLSERYRRQVKRTLVLAQLKRIMSTEQRWLKLLVASYDDLCYFNTRNACQQIFCQLHWPTYVCRRTTVIDRTRRLAVFLLVRHNTAWKRHKSRRARDCKWWRTNRISLLVVLASSFDRIFWNKKHCWCSNSKFACHHWPRCVCQWRALMVGSF